MSAIKIRLWGTEAECRAAAAALTRTPGLAIVSVSEPRADRGTSVLVRVYVEARLDPEPATVRAEAEVVPPRLADLRASALAQRMTRRRELPSGGE